MSLLLPVLLVAIGARVLALLPWTDNELLLVDQAARTLVGRHLSAGRALFHRFV
jgi:hypothetical protein